MTKKEIRDHLDSKTLRGTEGPPGDILDIQSRTDGRLMETEWEYNESKEKNFRLGRKNMGENLENHPLSCADGEKKKFGDSGSRCATTKEKNEDFVEETLLGGLSEGLKVQLHTKKD